MHPSHGRYHQQQASRHPVNVITTQGDNPTVYPALSRPTIHYRYTNAENTRNYRRGCMTTQASCANVRVPFNQEYMNQNINARFQTNTSYPPNQYIGNNNQPLPPRQTFGRTHHHFDNLREEIAEFVGLIELEHTKTRMRPTFPPPCCYQNRVRSMPNITQKPRQSLGLNQFNYTNAEPSYSSSNCSQTISCPLPNTTPDMLQTITSVSVVQDTCVSQDPPPTTSPIVYFEALSSTKNKSPATTNRPAFTQEFYDFIKSPQVYQAPEVRDEATSPGFWVCDPEIWRKEQERMNGSNNKQDSLSEQPSSSGVGDRGCKELNTNDLVSKSEVGIPVIDLTEDDSPSDEDQVINKSMGCKNTRCNVHSHSTTLHSCTSDDSNQTQSPFPSELLNAQNDDSPQGNSSHRNESDMDKNSQSDSSPHGSSSYSNNSEFESVDSCSPNENSSHRNESEMNEDSQSDSSPQGRSSHSNNSEFGSVDSFSPQENSMHIILSENEPMNDHSPHQKHSTSESEPMYEDMPKIVAYYSLNPKVVSERTGSSVDTIHKLYLEAEHEPASSKLNKRAKEILQNLPHTVRKEKSQKSSKHRPGHTIPTSMNPTAANYVLCTETSDSASSKLKNKSRKIKQNSAHTHTKSRRKEKKNSSKSRKTRKQQESPGTAEVSSTRKASLTQLKVRNASETISLEKTHVEKTEELHKGSSTSEHIDARPKNPNSPKLRSKVLQTSLSQQKHGNASSQESTLPVSSVLSCAMTRPAVIVNNIDLIQPIPTSACSSSICNEVYTQGERITIAKTSCKSHDLDNRTTSKFGTNYDEFSNEIMDFSLKHMRKTNERRQTREADYMQREDTPLDLSLQKDTGTKFETLKTNILKSTEINETESTPIDGSDSNTGNSTSKSSGSTGISAKLMSTSRSDTSCKTTVSTLDDTFVSSETNSYFQKVQQMSNKDIESAVLKTKDETSNDISAFNTTYDNVYSDGGILIEASHSKSQESDASRPEPVGNTDSVKAVETIVNITHTIIDDSTDSTSAPANSVFECSTANEIDISQEYEHGSPDSRGISVGTRHSNTNSFQEHVDTVQSSSRSLQHGIDTEKEQILKNNSDMLITDTENDGRPECSSVNKLVGGKQTVLRTLDICEQLPDVKEEEYKDNTGTLGSVSESRNLHAEEPDIFVTDNPPEYVQEFANSHDDDDDLLEGESPAICDIFVASDTSSESLDDRDLELSNHSSSDENATPAIIDTESSSSDCDIFVDSTPPTATTLNSNCPKFNFDLSNHINYPGNEVESDILGGTTDEKNCELSSETSSCLGSVLESTSDIKKTEKEGNSCDLGVANDADKLENDLLGEEESLLVVVVNDTDSSDTLLSEDSSKVDANETSTVYNSENIVSIVENVPNDGNRNNIINSAQRSGCDVNDVKVEIMEGDGNTTSPTQVEIHVDCTDVFTHAPRGSQDLHEEHGNTYSNKIIPKIEEDINEHPASVFKSIETDYDEDIICFAVQGIKYRGSSPEANENVKNVSSTSEDTGVFSVSCDGSPEASVDRGDAPSMSNDYEQTSSNEAPQTANITPSEHCVESNAERKNANLRRSISTDHDYVKQKKGSSPVVYNDMHIETISLLTSSEDEAGNTSPEEEKLDDVDDMLSASSSNLHKKGRKRKSIHDRHETVEAGGVKNKTARMGDWKSSSVSVLSEILHQPLPCYETAQKTQVQPNIPVIDVLLGMGVIFKEQNEDVLPEHGSTSSIPHKTSDGVINFQDKETRLKFHLKPCFVRLERLDLPT